MSRGFAGPRTIVTTDPELDDLNSMLRLLLYANEIDIVGLVYSSSRFHHAGDPAAGVAPHRWPAPGSVFHIDEAVNAYGEAYPHLVVHDPRYPSPERLRSLIAWGNVTGAGDTFSSSFMYAYMTTHDVAESARFANAAAAMSVGTPGARGGMTTEPEVRAFLARATA